MSENICSVCGEKFEDKYFDKEQNKCILHCEKDDWYIVKNGNKNWQSEQKINYFWKTLQEEIIKLENKEEYIFFKIVFPKHEKDYKLNENNLENQATNFNAYDYSNDKLIQPFYSKKVVFEDCKFIDDLNLLQYEAKNTIKFISCCFFSKKFRFPLFKNNNIEFSNIDFFEKIEFYSPQKQNTNSLKFIYVNFYKDANFMKLDINLIEFYKVNCEILNLYNCNLQKYRFVDLKIDVGIITDSYFGVQLKESLHNNNLLFKSYLSISRSSNLPILNCSDNSSINIRDSKNIRIENNKSKLLGILDIKNSDLDFIDISNKSKIKEIKFENLKILNVFDISSSEIDKCTINNVVSNSLCNFSNVKIKDGTFNSFLSNNINFLDIKINCLTRETARIIKDSFEQQNNIIEANKYYALEMKKREEELTKDLKEGKNFFEWLVFKVHGISSNHSQDWLLALFWIISFTFSIGTITNYFDEYQISFINLIPAFFIFIMSLIIASLEIEFKNILLIIFGFISYGLYSMISCDFNLYNVTNHINPFSVMNSWDNITFPEFIYKVTIAYLIYQFIISIRQNTRRK